METPKNNEAKVIEEQLQDVHPKQTEMTNTIKNPLDKREIPDANKSEKKIRKNKRKQRKQISTKEIANSIIKDLSCCRPIRLGTWLLLVAILLISVLPLMISCCAVYRRRCICALRLPGHAPAAQCPIIGPSCCVSI